MNINKVDSILKSPSKPSVTLQTLTNQYSGNQANVTFSNIGKNCTNNNTANVNVAAGHSGEDNSNDSSNKHDVNNMKGW